MYKNNKVLKKNKVMEKIVKTVKKVKKVNSNYNLLQKIAKKIIV